SGITLAGGTRLARERPAGAVRNSRRRNLPVASFAAWRSARARAPARWLRRTQGPAATGRAARAGAGRPAIRTAGAGIPGDRGRARGSAHALADRRVRGVVSDQAARDDPSIRTLAGRARLARCAVRRIAGARR